MGAPKQKWTPEQEAALRKGVEKHGPGKWRTIQKDPEFASILATRSNVDLKDKWRNMNVGLGGHGSREKSSKSFPRYPAMKGTEDVSLVPSIHSGDISTEDTHGIADSLASSDSSKERKSLDPRYTDLIINAITELKDPNGSSTTAVAAYIEAHHPVPSNFRRLLSSKLRDMVSQGNLVKVKQNYKVRAAEPAFKYDGQSAQERNDGNQQTTETYQDAGLLANYGKNWKGEPAAKKVKLDAEFVRLKMKTAEEAARAAALAVAEAEAAAAAAEKAAKEAEVAEAEAEAAEMAAEVAAYYARRSSKKVCSSTFPVEDLAVAV